MQQASSQVIVAANQLTANITALNVPFFRLSHSLLSRVLAFAQSTFVGIEHTLQDLFQTA